MPPSQNDIGGEYQLVDGISAPTVLLKQELLKLIEVLNPKNKRIHLPTRKHKTSRTDQIDDNMVTQIVSLIKPYYHGGLRNDFVMCLAGWFRKEGISIDESRKVIDVICQEDEEKYARLRTLEETYNKENLDDLIGYSGLIEILTNELENETLVRSLLDKVQTLFHQKQKHDVLQEEVEEQEEEKSIVEEVSQAILTTLHLLTLTLEMSNLLSI